MEEGSKDKSRSTGSQPEVKQSSNHIDSAATPTDAEDWHEETLTEEPEKYVLWKGWDGLGIMTFGVVIPCLIILLGLASCPKRLTLVLLNHPVETLVELLLVFLIPIANYMMWSSFRKNDIRFSLKRGLALGAAFATSVLVAVMCAAGVAAGYQGLEPEIGTLFTTGFCWITMLSLLAATSAGYITYKFRLTRDFPSSRNQIVVYTVTGAIITALAFVAAEARPWCIRLAQRMTVSTSMQEHQAGLNWLRQLNPERELRMECSDSRAAGLAGLFFPIKSSSQHQIYFAVTGKPFSYKDITSADLSVMPDDYVSRHAVGDKIKGLSLIRSSLSSTIHPETLSSTVNWTFVFKNSTAAPQEARAEIGLPPGAVITGLTRWTNGEPEAAQFVASGKAEGVSNWVQVDHSSPAIISDLGRGRLLMHCFPVAPQEQLKIRLTAVVSLKPDGSKTASFVLPKFIATNFDLKGQHLARIRSSMQLSSTLKNLKPDSTSSGDKLLYGQLDSRQMEASEITVIAGRPAVPEPVIVLDKIAVNLAHEDEQRREAKQKENDSAQPQQVVLMIDGSKGLQHQLDNVTAALNRSRDTQHSQKPRIKTIKPRYVVESIASISAQAPKHLVVVIDGSLNMTTHAAELVNALSQLPPNIQASMIIASQEEPKLMNPVPLAQGLKNLKEVKFIGGQDNLQAVVRAAELAGETKGGAVLWIHGPQPVLNSDIYIMTPYSMAPAFYELAVESGETDTYEFFKNHSEIGPFTQVPRNTSLSADLGRFFAKWQPGSNDYAIAFYETTVKSEKGATFSGNQGWELIQLNAYHKCLKLINERKMKRAARLAVAYSLVTPVSSALVMENPQSTASNDSDVEEAGESKASSEADEGTSIDLRSGQSNETSLPDYALAPTPRPTPGLRGASNTTIGINKTGTVRINNLANLEALFNIIANGSEIACLLVGIVVVVHALFNRIVITELMGMPVNLGPGRRMAIGIILILAGLAVPGLINWFVASARDANLFS